MFRAARMALRRGGGSGRLPRSIADMPCAPLRHGWGAVGQMTPQERHELLRGEWTNARPVRLVPDPVERDAGGFAEGLCFASDDEAAAFLAQEDDDDAVEQAVPSVQLARSFFEELALSADTEVDVENVMEATVEPDEERARETLAVHCRFFAEYYERQGLVAEAEKQHLVDNMTRPPGLLLAVNSAFPFVRCVVSWQLARHALEAQRAGRGAVFIQHPSHPLLFAAEMLPYQPVRDVNLFPACDGSSALAPCGAAGALTDGRAVEVRQETDAVADSPSCEAANLALLLEDEVPCSGVVSVDKRSVRSSPLTIDHIYWLQRQVAADVLVDTDILGALVPLLLRTASTAAGTRLVLDMSSHSHRVRERCYSKDIASYVAQCNEGKEGKIECVVVSLVPPGRSVSSSAGGNLSASAVPKGRVSAQASEEDVPPADDDTKSNSKDGVVERQLDSGYHLGVESRLLVRAARRRVFEGLRGACDFVLCCPDTTADGCKPRAPLGVVGGAGGGGEEQLVVHRFVSVCSRVNKLFPYLRSELMSALQYASPRGGCVVYATHSLNPLENEAVVASVLTDLSRKGREGVYRLIPLPTCEEQPPPDNAPFSLSSILSGGRNGLQSWVSLQDGQPEQDRSYCDDRIVADVARCSWRGDPIRAVEDVCYVCVIEVCARVDHSLSKTAEPEFGPVAGDAMSDVSLSALLPWCDLERLRERWGLVVCGATEEGDRGNKGGCVVCTTAVRRVVGRLGDGLPSGASCGVAAYGARLDDCSTIHRTIGKKGDRILVRASISGTLLAYSLCDSVDEAHRASRVVRLPVLAVIRLLRTGSLTSTRLAALQVSGCHAATTLLDTDGMSVEGERTVFLTVEVPEPFSSSELRGMELHQDLQNELRKLVLVATAVLNRSSSTGGSCVVFRLKGTTPQERSVLSERVVAISDALQYLLRQLGYPESVWNPLACDDTPEIVMQEDEYELEASSVPRCNRRGHTNDSHVAAAVTTERNLLGKGAERRHERRMLGMRKVLRSLGAAVDGNAVNDWERDVRHWKRFRRTAL